MKTILVKRIKEVDSSFCSFFTFVLFPYPLFSLCQSALCMTWLGDKIHNIREAAVVNLAQLAETFGKQWALIINHAVDLAEQNQQQCDLLCWDSVKAEGGNVLYNYVNSNNIPIGRKPISKYQI